MALYLSKYPAGVTMMNSYLFARQLGKNQWTKMDYDEARRTGLTNLAEYNQVGSLLLMRQRRSVTSFPERNSQTEHANKKENKENFVFAFFEQ